MTTRTRRPWRLEYMDVPGTGLWQLYAWYTTQERAQAALERLDGLECRVLCREDWQRLERARARRRELRAERGY